jgi:hypothetical protein
LETITLYIVTNQTHREEIRFFIDLEGVVAKPGYMLNHYSRITDKKTSVDAIKEVAQQYFTIDSNVTSSDDEQNWVQANTSDREFVHDLWLRSYIPESWMAIGISSIGDAFIMRDIKKLVREEPKWTFGYGQTQPTDIIVMHIQPVESNAGFMNAFHGYARTQAQLGTADGEVTQTESQSSPLLTSRGELPTRSEISTGRRQPPTVLTDNMHPKYHEALRQNLQNLSTFSSFGVRINFGTTFQPIKILDLCQFNEDVSGQPGAEYASGNYIVARVARVFQNYTHQTEVHLTREASGEH